jgi:glycosyltransferase involved in cell wall biosynthesis
MKSYCPIVNANPDNLEEKVELLIINKKNLNEIGKKSREYALEYHSPKKVAEKILKVFKEEQ